MDGKRFPARRRFRCLVVFVVSLLVFSTTTSREDDDDDDDDIGRKNRLHGSMDTWSFDDRSMLDNAKALDDQEATVFGILMITE